MEISICIGSSCHLKGSYDIINLLKEQIAKHHLEDKVVLSASFCLGCCSADGVSMKVGDQVLTGVTAANFQGIFDKYVLEALN